MATSSHQSAVPNTADSTFLAPKLSLWRRLNLSIRLYLFRALVSTALTIRNLAFFRNTSILPTFTKVYRCQPTLVNRVFIPPSYKGDEALLPLYLDIHGGGFVFGNPGIDDQFCANFSKDNKVLVVSLDYPKAPSHPYPAAVHALSDSVKAILEDEALPFDKTKVAIGGFSAGGNLSLAVAQNEGLQGKIGAVVSYYGPMDFMTKAREKLLTRPVGASPDRLAPNVAMFNYGYVNPGQDLRDPLMSVTYAQRNMLPPKICVIGCELDLLCREAEIFAEKMADVGEGEKPGSNILWEKNGVRWEKIIGEEHGFDAVPAWGEKRIRVSKRKQEMYGSVAEWLFREVYL